MVEIWRSDQTTAMDRFAWLCDNEFSRQALAGVNPVNIELFGDNASAAVPVDNLTNFPPVNTPVAAPVGHVSMSPPWGWCSSSCNSKQIDNIFIGIAIKRCKFFCQSC
ncbi:unnamed protein product [Camellia sinensis]